MAELPGVLISYAFADNALGDDPTMLAGVDWVLDSGAFSAFTSGRVVELSAYIDYALAALAGPAPPSAIMSLDVIGDPEASLKNCDAMRAAGVPAVNAFHYGTPWHYLADAAKGGRVAMGGVAQRGAGGHGLRITWKKKISFLEQAFARIWPCWVHGFGCCDARILRAIPLASADSTSWSYGLQRYGHISGLKNGSGVKPGNCGVEAWAAILAFNLNYYAKIERTGRIFHANKMRAAGLQPFKLKFVLSTPGDWAAVKAAYRSQPC